MSSNETRRGPLWKLSSALVYPALIGGNLAIAVVGLRSGASIPVLVTGLALGTAVAIAVLERILPYRTEWWLRLSERRGRRELAVDVLFSLSAGGAAELGRSASVQVFTAAAARLSASVGAPLWPVSWPWLAQLPLALVVGELGLYWVHRLEHTRSALLWRLHAMHHSVPRLYWLNSGRNHPIESFVSLFVMAAPLALLGAGPDVLTLLVVATTAHSFLQHCNVDARLGPLNWILSSPEVHRWHHSRTLAEANANYGSWTLVWDLVFRTRRVPVDHAPPVDVGLEEDRPFPQTFLGQLASPFTGSLFRR